MTTAMRPVVRQLVLRGQSLAVPSARHLAAKACFSTCVSVAHRVRARTAFKTACRGLTSSIGWTPKTTYRAYSARAVDQGGSVHHVFVRCRLSGSIIVSLYNVFEHPPTTPLLLYLPPWPQPHIKETEKFDLDSEAKPESFTEDLAQPPDYLLRLNMPVASIRYRWSAAPLNAADAETIQEEARTKVQPLSFLWPTPLHDVIFAYDWIKKNLAPPPVKVDMPDRSWREPSANILHPRRDLYVYGSHLGASLATSLALTESHLDQHIAIRGLITYNGIYNWTAFVKMPKNGIPVADDPVAVNGITPGIPPLSSLFGAPKHLFDDFVSPCLMFRTPGRVVAPLDFDKEINQARIEEAEEAEIQDEGATPPRQKSTLLMGMLNTSYLSFPPTTSTLTIPPTLLMHTQTGRDAMPAIASEATDKRGTVYKAVHGKNSYAAQAGEMASLMRRGLIMCEMKRTKEDEQMESPESQAENIVESERRVQQVRVGPAPTDGTLEPGKEGQKIIVSWLNEHMGIAAGHSKL